MRLPPKDQLSALLNLSKPKTGCHMKQIHVQFNFSNLKSSLFWAISSTNVVFLGVLDDRVKINTFEATHGEKYDLEDNPIWLHRGTQIDSFYQDILRCIVITPAQILQLLEPLLPPLFTHSIKNTTTVVLYKQMEPMSGHNPAIKVSPKVPTITSFCEYLTFETWGFCSETESKWERLHWWK